MLTTKRWLAATAAMEGALALMAPGAMGAVPGVSTGGANSITADAAKLHGAVNPQSRPTAYYFEYGTSRRYGSRTPDSTAGSGSKRVNVTAAVGGLKPNSTYHYRLVASNPDGVTSGGDRSFTTKKVPLGLTLAASPNPMVFGAGTNIAGQLTGTGNAGKNGNFSFAALALPSTTQLRVRTTDGKVSSQVATVAVAVRVKTKVSHTRVKRGRRVRFSGTIRPGREGAQYAIQKLNRSGQWSTLAGGITRRGSTAFSGFSRRVRIRRGGQYRVFVRIIDGNYTSGIGRTIRLRTHR